jgi:hypothetical protein
VLEQVSEPGTSLAFVSRADVVINGDRNNRHGLIPIQDDPQTVREGKLFYLERS